MPLTDAQIKKLKYSPEGNNKHSDYEGLYLEVRSTGAKFWRWRYRLQGKEQLLTIGRFPDVLVEDARTLRAEARKQLKEGKSPAREKQAAKVRATHENAQTFEAVYREWLITRNWADSTRSNRINQIELHVLPLLGALPVKEITAMQVLDVLRNATKTAEHTKVKGKGARIRQIGSPAVASRLRQYIAGVFNVAIASGRCDNNPAGSLREVMTPLKDTIHKTPLTPIQIGKVLRAIDEYKGEFKTVAALHLLWWTFLRPGEIVGAQWSEFDLDAGLWVIPRSRMKMKKESLGAHTVPLPSQAVAALKKWRDFAGGIGYVFPHRDNHEPMIAGSLTAAARRLKLDFVYVPHATRTTASTLLNGMGFGFDVIERQLDHEDKNEIRRSYNRAEYLDDRRIMLQQWADMLDTWKAGGKVVDISKQEKSKAADLTLTTIGDG